MKKEGKAAKAKFIPVTWATWQYIANLFDKPVTICESWSPSTHKIEYYDEKKKKWIPVDIKKKEA